MYSHFLKAWFSCLSSSQWKPVQKLTWWKYYQHSGCKFTRFYWELSPHAWRSLGQVSTWVLAIMTTAMPRPRIYNLGFKGQTGTNAEVKVHSFLKIWRSRASLRATKLQLDLRSNLGGSNGLVHCSFVIVALRRIEQTLTSVWHCACAPGAHWPVHVISSFFFDWR